MHSVYFSLGSNLGNRMLNLKKAVNLLGKGIIQTPIYSSVYETKAWGNTQQPDFLNMVVKGVTKLTPLQLLNHCQEIEKTLGRKRIEHWGSRIIDIDILFYEDQVINIENLKIPHPYLHKRKFVLAPLKEIAAEFLHPILKKTIKTLYSTCEDDLNVCIFDTNQQI